MAIYHASVKIISRSTGRSSVAAAAYRSASKLTDERDGRTHDYSRKGSVVHSEIMVPEGAPAWATDRARLWNEVEAAEKRKDSQLAREIEIALPRELTPAQRVELVRGFLREKCVAHGMVADFSIHAPKGLDGAEQPHAHVMLTMRRIGPEGFGKKATEWNPEFAKKDGQGFVADASPLVDLREAWADHVNRALEGAGVGERVDHRSLATQRAAAAERGDEVAAAVLDRRPEPKIGAIAAEMVRAGRAEQAHAWREVRGVRQDRVQLRQLAGQVVDLVASARRLVEHQAQRLGALGGRLEAAMQAVRERAGRPAEPSPAAKPLTDAEITGRWKALVDRKFAEIAARARALAERAQKHGDHYRKLHEHGIVNRPSFHPPQEPKGLFSFLSRKAWEKDMEQWRIDTKKWESAQSKLSKKIGHHEKRAGRLIREYADRTPYYETRGSRMSEKLAAKESPQLKRELEGVKQREQEANRRKIAQEIAQRNQRGRGPHGRGGGRGRG